MRISLIATKIIAFCAVVAGLSIPLTASADVVTNSIPVGSGPASIVVSPNGATAYIANYGSNTVSVIETATNVLTNTIAVGNGPWGLALNPSGTKLYVTNYLGHSVTGIDTTSLSVDFTTAAVAAPNGIAVSPNGSTLYVATNNTPTVITKLNATTGSIAGTIAVGGNGTVLADVEISPNGTRLFVSDRYNAKIYDINLGTEVVTDRVVGTDPLWLAISADGNKLYVSENVGHQFEIYNTGTWGLDAAVDMGVGNNPWGIGLNPAGDRIYVANNSADTINVYKTSDHTLIGQIPVASGPWGLAFSSGDIVYVTQNSGNTVSVVSPANLTASSQNISGTVGDTLSATVTANNFTPSTIVTRTISPALPAGLSLNSTTGVITGTPTTSQIATTYTITGTDGTWTATTTLSIAIAAVPAALPNTGFSTGATGYLASTLILAGLLLGLSRYFLERHQTKKSISR